MLPFLRNRQTASVSMPVKKVGPEVEHSETNLHADGLNACAFDLLRAIESKDTAAVANALKAAFDLCESMPHNEHSEEF